MNDIEILKTIKNMLLHAETQLLDYEALALEGLLNLYNKEKERNKDLEQIEQEHKKENGRLREEKDKKDKIIYNLAFALADYVMYYEYDKCRNPEMIKYKAKEQIEYFTNKVEEDIKE